MGRTQTRAEELINSITHAVGALIAIPGTVVLIVHASMLGEPRRIVAVSIFGATLIMLYAASTLYHTVPISRMKSRLRVFDHVAIYFLIAGTYTPFTLVALRGGWGWSLFGVVWGLALLGTVLKLFMIGRFRILSVVVYVAMGWMVIIAIRPLMEHLSAPTLRWLLAGGVAYTAGIVFYANQRLRFSHGIWHLFVLAGSVSHYVAVLTMPAAA